MRTKPRNVRLPPDLEKSLVDFCQLTNRDEPHTVRAIIRLFLAEGPETANQRLSKGLWEQRSAADYVLPEPPARPKRPRKSVG